MIIIDSFIPRIRSSNRKNPLYLPFLLSFPLTIFIYFIARHYSYLFDEGILSLIFPFILSSRGIIATFSLQDSYQHRTFFDSLKRFAFILSSFLIFLGIVTSLYGFFDYHFRTLLLVTTLGLTQLIFFLIYKVFEKLLSRFPQNISYPIIVFLYLGLNDVGIFFYLASFELTGINSFFENFILGGFLIFFLIVIFILRRIYDKLFHDWYIQITALMFGFSFNFLQGLQLFQSNNSSSSTQLIPLITTLVNIGGNLSNLQGIFFYELNKFQNKTKVFRSLFMILPWLLLSPLIIVIYFELPLKYYFLYLAFVIIQNFIFFSLICIIFFLFQFMNYFTLTLCVLTSLRDLWETVVMVVYVKLSP